MKSSIIGHVAGALVIMTQKERISCHEIIPHPIGRYKRDLPASLCKRFSIRTSGEDEEGITVGDTIFGNVYAFITKNPRQKDTPEERGLAIIP